MITRLGAAFTAASDGDMRQPDARHRVSNLLGVQSDWALAGQVHGGLVATVDRPGLTPDHDGLVTDRPGLPLAVRTADCLGIVLHGEGVVGVAHAGWRGLVAGVIPATVEAMRSVGGPALRAIVGPSIGPCCFEVGPEVLECFADFEGRTSWGTPSVDLWAAASASLPGVEVEVMAECTTCGSGWFSHREDGTSERLAAIGWIP